MLFSNIKTLAEQNEYFRKVMHTGIYCQLVIMSIPIGEDIGAEVHASTDQVLLIMRGKAEIEIGNETQEVEDDNLVFIPAGIKHNVTNIGDDDLKLLSIYAPSEHPELTIHKTKLDAQKGELP